MAGKSSGQKEMDVNLQDQVTRPIDFYFLQALGVPTTVATETAEEDTTLVVASAAGCTVGDYLGMFEDGRFYFGEILSIATNTITLDTPIDSVFTVGSTVACFDRNMENGNGSLGSPDIYDVEVGGSGTQSIDITRIIIQIETATTPELSDFGDIAGGLTNGIVIRRNNSVIENIFNFKTNADIQNNCYDLALFNTGGIFGGAEGFCARISFSGQAKHGVALRLNPGDKLECLVQDNLTSLNSFRIVVQGHIVD